MADEGFLTRKFGEGVENYYSGSPLNRLAFLRTNHSYLSTALQHPSTRFLLLNNLDPLASTPSTLAFLSYSDISPLISNPYSTSEKEVLESFTSTVDHPVLIFLGIDESAPQEHKIPTPDGKYSGQAYFSLDITPYPHISYSSTAASLLNSIKQNYPLHEFKTARKDLNLGNEHAAIYASARTLTNWNVTAPFCAGCGQKTLSVNAGTKRACPPKDGGVETRKCPSREGVHNINFPRTDPTVIMAVISSDGTKILLGRQKKWPKYWHSTLAGFLEPGESIEEAVRREVWEESGVTVGRVVIHSSQPWPFPASLMIGAIGEALPGKEEIYLGNDPELEGAKWFEFEEVKEALGFTSGLYEGTPEGYKEGGLRLPPKTAIANQLIRAVVLGEIHLAKI
ncbi:NADH pyrophosphatase [Orbilia oligospora]|uniref:NAD(+) diphosphatase n=1 Tax=Orbilia oligospora TaxID=2813651 RepID=A0A6G1LV10_ORBOL|nr:NADH pyrophosphatase [Orbilia oligospora]KAF3206731.1 NADH pyrophosphatase [Orbilia oligospora]KAF3208438.1 NADH pyrophosphatase [Orbilia oligospora]KAF3220201.1 NADH pyrophosphatase [Orbilia oligospora]KAF3234976.1 NADH pyrophosphatase [Orbilia oligospora]